MSLFDVGSQIDVNTWKKRNAVSSGAGAALPQQYVDLFEGTRAVLQAQYNAGGGAGNIPAGGANQWPAADRHKLRTTVFFDLKLIDADFTQADMISDLCKVLAHNGIRLGVAEAVDVFPTAASLRELNGSGGETIHPTLVTKMIEFKKALDKAKSDEEKRSKASKSKQPVVAMNVDAKTEQYNMGEMSSKCKTAQFMLNKFLVLVEGSHGESVPYVCIAEAPWSPADANWKRDYPISELAISEGITDALTNLVGEKSTEGALKQVMLELGVSKKENIPPHQHLGALNRFMTTAGTAGALGDNPLVVVVSYIAIVIDIMSQFGGKHGVAYDVIFRKKVAMEQLDYTVFLTVDQDVIDAIKNKMHFDAAASASRASNASNTNQQPQKRRRNGGNMNEQPVPEPAPANPAPVAAAANPMPNPPPVPAVAPNAKGGKGKGKKGGK